MFLAWFYHVANIPLFLYVYINICVYVYIMYVYLYIHQYKLLQQRFIAMTPKWFRFVWHISALILAHINTYSRYLQWHIIHICIVFNNISHAFTKYHRIDFILSLVFETVWHNVLYTFYDTTLSQQAYACILHLHGAWNNTTINKVMIINIVSPFYYYTSSDWQLFLPLVCLRIAW